MKRILKKIWNFIKNIFNKLDDEVKRIVPVAINIVEAVKKVMDSPVDEVIATILKQVIPGDADNVLIDQVKSFIEKNLPKVLLDLNLVNSIAGIEDENEKLKAILAQFKLSSDETKNILYHGLAALAIEKLSDGKLSWSDAVALSEYYYKNVVKNETNG